MQSCAGDHTQRPELGKNLIDARFPRLDPAQVLLRAIFRACPEVRQVMRRDNPIDSEAHWAQETSRSDRAGEVLSICCCPPVLVAVIMHDHFVQCARQARHKI
jgi:hypothetical protein